MTPDEKARAVNELAKQGGDVNYQPEVRMNWAIQQAGNPNVTPDERQQIQLEANTLRAQREFASGIKTERERREDVMAISNENLEVVQETKRRAVLEGEVAGNIEAGKALIGQAEKIIESQRSGLFTRRTGL